VVTAQRTTKKAFEGPFVFLPVIENNGDEVEPVAVTVKD
jgi:hypothetical protein